MNPGSHCLKYTDTPKSEAWVDLASSENSPVTGNWIDFTIQELIPFVESKYRVRQQRESRALVGYFVGGRGAFYFAMHYPELFSVVYALHPVATGTGYSAMTANPDWDQIHRAESTAALTGFSVPYISFHQAFLPNPNRPPFYCDLRARCRGSAGG